MKLGKRPQVPDYRGVRQGFEPKDTLLEPLDNGRGFITIISEETLAPERDINHKYYCPDCKAYLCSVPNGNFVCKDNPHCSKYMQFVEVDRDNLQTAKNAELDSPIGSGEDIEPVFMSFDPDKLSDNRDSRMTVTYESAKGRIKHVKWKGHPKSLAIEDNS